MPTLLSLLILGCFLAQTAPALTVEPGAIDRLLNEADFVAEIEVRGITDSDSPDQGLSREAEVLVHQVLSANSTRTLRSNQIITIRSPGGESHGQGSFLTGYPRLYSGHRYRAHLKEVASDQFEIAGFSFGLTDLTARRQYSRNRTDGSNGQGDGPFLFWPDHALPIPYFISGESFLGHDDYLSAIDSSFQTWRELGNIKVEFISMGCTTTLKNENDGQNSVILLTDRWPFSSEAIAITRNFYVAGESPQAGLILDSDILLNGVNHKFTVTNEAGHHDIQNILTHEIGHFLGLGHEVEPADTDATMYAVASPNETSKRKLHTNDLRALYEGYAGVSEKLGTPQTICQIPRNVGCASSPQAPSPTTLLFGLLYLGGLILGGRQLMNRLASDRFI